MCLPRHSSELDGFVRLTAHDPPTEDFERLFAVLKRVISFTLNVKARKFCFSRRAVSRLRLHRGLHYLSSLLCYLKTSFLSGNQDEEMIQQNETKRAKPPK